jgi:hypothetical protein
LAATIPPEPLSGRGSFRSKAAVVDKSRCKLRKG